MKPNLLLLSGWAALALPSHSAVLASTSFENEVDGGFYTDTDVTSHDLVNSGGTVTDDGTVDSTGSSTSAGDLSFDAAFVSTGPGSGFSDGDFVGVTGFTGTVGSFTDGSQGYQMSDTDGQMVLTFGTVDISGESNVQVSLDYFITSTGWETSDSFIISVVTNEGLLSILDTTGSDIDDLGIQGAWINGSIAVPDSASSVYLTVALESNSSAEGIYLDNVVIQTVPEPSAVILGGLGMMAFLRRRR
ncbi:MAG: PEP-CTERM sorting domain-containing protein [Verrucomicrobiota bacterium JB023]|nr:PEP-CTERM sorting domain-containing protein [Verrucomicrobiota bacterium JB023]